MGRIALSLGALEGSLFGGVHRFLGVPYAEPVTATRRFMPPVPKGSWLGVLAADTYGATCIQTPMPGLFECLSPDLSLVGSDCLNLNIWTPDPKASLPVMVWIHGGAFFAGTGSDETYQGDAFARSGVVCVTINYRLGAQGFLDLSSLDERYESSGCVGIMDQVCALKWVNDHIAQFGGDPNRVTIAGESAGAMSVSTLLATPSATGLFQRAIAQSGASNNTMPKGSAQIVTRELLKKLGVRDLTGLSEVSDEQLLGSQVELMQEISESQDVEHFGAVTGTLMSFLPVHGCAFLPEQPSIALSKVVASEVALLQGVTCHEAPIFFYELADTLDLDSAQQLCAPLVQAAGLDKDETLNHYLNLPGPLLTRVGAFLSDFMFNIPTLTMLSTQVVHNPNVWAYRFDWENPGFEGLLQAHHFIELPFVFQTLGSSGAKKFGIDQAPSRLADITHKAWIAFITHGDPNHDELPEWPRWQSDSSRPCMSFNDSCTLDTLVDETTLKVWGLQEDFI